MTTTQPTSKRFCFYILIDQFVQDRGYVPSVVYEDEAGHAPLIGRGECAEPWYWGTDYETAKRVAADANAKLGLSEDDVLDIVCSSMAASNRANATRAAQQARLVDLFGSDEEKAEQFESDGRQASGPCVVALRRSSLADNGYRRVRPGDRVELAGTRS